MPKQKSMKKKKKEKVIIDLRTGKKTRIPLEEALKELRQDVGDKLYYKATKEQREFIALTSGTLDYSEPWFDRILIRLKLKKDFSSRVKDKLNNH